MKTVAIIPARYASERLPGKPLALIAGKPMIEHVVRRTRQAALVSEVIVATDDERIASAVRAFGGTAVMTSPGLVSGTDRVAAVAQLLPAAARSARLVWTIHDMNPFTGGCHFDGGCGRYADRCGACPQLGSTQTDDLSRVVWRRKRAALDAIPRDRLHLVAPSRWLESAVRASSLFGHLPLRTIPNGLETDVLVPGDRSAARTALGLPQDVPVLLFVANSLSDHRKGLDLLLEAVRPLTASSTVHLASLGRHEGSSQGELGITRLGWVESDRMLAAAYSAADLFVTTPRQDNLPNTVLEAMACGTPVVAFDVGGIPDMVRPHTTGMLVPPGDVEGLRATIVSLLRDENARKTMGEMCRRVAVEEYSLGLQAQRYLELYRQTVPTKAAEWTASESARG